MPHSAHTRAVLFASVENLNQQQTMTRTFKLLTNKGFKGTILLTYVKEQFSSLHVDAELVTPNQWEYLHKDIRLQLQDYLGWRKLHWEELLSPTITSHNKIKAFCTAYKERIGAAYKVSPADSGKIKHVEITDHLLTVYFGSVNFIFRNKSIANYVKYYNELRAEASGNVYNGIRLPDTYSPAFEVECKGDKGMLSAYYKHLRQLGYIQQPVQGKGLIWINTTVPKINELLNKSKIGKE